MKTMQAGWRRASRNSLRMRDAPTPAYISTKSEPLAKRNGTSASPAIDLASSVFPTPPRAALVAATYVDARRVLPSLSAQSFALGKKILEVEGALEERVFEVHPEVSFAALAGGHLVFAEPDPALALRSSSRSGLALALRWCGRLAGILAVESSRRDDFAWPPTPEQEALLEAEGLRLCLEEFRAVHRERHRADLWFDVDSADFRGFCRRLHRAAESDCNVLFSGPPGSSVSNLGGPAAVVWPLS